MLPAPVGLVSLDEDGGWTGRGTGPGPGLVLDGDLGLPAWALTWSNDKNDTCNWLVSPVVTSYV